MGDTILKLQSTRVRGAPLPPLTREALAKLVERHGERGARRRTNLSPTALNRALAGLPVLPGTAALVAMALAESVGARANGQRRPVAP